MGVNNISFNFLTLNDSDYEVNEIFDNSMILLKSYLEYLEKYFVLDENTSQPIDFLLELIEQAFIQKKVVAYEKK